MKEIEATLSLRNNRLRALRLKRGLTQKEVALAIGISKGGYSHMETLRCGARDKCGEWHGRALRAAAFFGCEPWWLFPPVVDEVAKSGRRKAVREIDYGEVAALLEPLQEVPLLPDAVLEGREDIEIMLGMRDQLSDREKFIVDHRFGLNGEEEWFLDRIGEALGVSRERARQLEIRALKKMRAGFGPPKPE